MQSQHKVKAHGRSYAIRLPRGSFCCRRSLASHAFSGPPDLLRRPQLCRSRKEMGGDPTKDEPFFFMKPADAILPNGETMPYPPRPGSPA